MYRNSDDYAFGQFQRSRAQVFLSLGAGVTTTKVIKRSLCLQPGQWIVLMVGGLKLAKKANAH